MSAVARLAYFGRTALSSMGRSPYVHVVAVASLTLSLCGFGLTRVAQAQLLRLMDSLGGEVELTVYLSPGVTGDQLDAVESELSRRAQAPARRVSPQEALARVAAQLGQSGPALEALEDNPLPWTVEVRLSPQARQPEALAALAAEVRALPGVAQVDYGEAALRRLEAISRGLTAGGALAFALVFLTAIIVVSATLQLAIFARKEEMEIQKLVGATDAFVRAPFLLEGALQGLASAALSLLAVVAAARWLEGAGAFDFALVSGRLVVDWARLAVELLATGVALGLLGSFIAVRRFLSV